MSKFNDKLNREWQLEVNVSAMRRAKKVDIDLSMPINQLQQFLFDDCFLVDALWSIVSPNANGITLGQFEAGFDGKVIEAAREALWEALCEYYDDPKAEMLRAAASSAREMVGEAFGNLPAELAKAKAELTTLAGSTEAKAS